MKLEFLQKIAVVEDVTLPNDQSYISLQDVFLVHMKSFPRIQNIVVVILEAEFSRTFTRYFFLNDLNKHRWLYD